MLNDSGALCTAPQIDSNHGGLHLLLPDGWSPVTCHDRWIVKMSPIKGSIAVGRCFHWDVRSYICGSFPTVHRVGQVYTFTMQLSKAHEIVKSAFAQPVRHVILITVDIRMAYVAQ